MVFRRVFPGAVTSLLAACAIGFAGVSSTTAFAADAPSLVRGLPDFTDLVEAVSPSVVNIRTLERSPGPSSNGASNGLDPDVLEFFRRFGIPVPPGMNPEGQGRQRRGNGNEEPQAKGLGSGFILSADGFIMTNAHVVDGADEVVVTLPDKREFKAKLVGEDRRTDVAIVKIDAASLPAVKIGEVSRLRVGEWVMAIGSPFGLDNSVTAGIVSAKQRETGDFLPFIQTDVAINPGNSGGPLINMRGEVIGINSQIYSRSGGYQGISFAIPIDEAMRVADQLRATGKVTRGRIGVQIDRVSKEVAESIGLGNARGALVRGVQPDSPAAKAGVEAGDIVLEFDGKAVGQVADLPRIVANTKPGRKVPMTVYRRGGERRLSITVAELESEEAQPSDAKEQDSPAPKGFEDSGMGLTVSDLSAAQQKEMGISGGVLVQKAQGAASRAGLREGDVILSIANAEVKDVAAFESITRRMDRRRPVSILFKRGDWVQYVVVRVANG